MSGPGWLTAGREPGARPPAAELSAPRGCRSARFPPHEGRRRVRLAFLAFVRGRGAFPMAPRCRMVPPGLSAPRPASSRGGTPVKPLCCCGPATSGCRTGPRPTNAAVIRGTFRASDRRATTPANPPYSATSTAGGTRNVEHRKLGIAPRPSERLSHPTIRPLAAATQLPTSNCQRRSRG